MGKNDAQELMRYQHWVCAVRDRWGIDVKLVRLDGEYDLNFLAEGTDDQDYILKIMRADCETSLVDMQVRAFEHIMERAPDLPARV